MPTLICACLHDMVNLRILQSRLSPQHVIVYLRSEMASHQQAPDSSATSLALATLVEDPSELPIVSMEYGLAARLSPLKWADALTYFASRPESPTAELLQVGGLEPPPRRSE